MARAARVVTVERGVDPRELTLMAFGGSGPAHACELAALLGMNRVLFPPGPGVFTASGMLARDPTRELARPWTSLLHDLEPEAIALAMAEMARQAKQDLRQDSGDKGSVELAF